ncbi:MAG: FHA domain-containing protein [Pirellulaceae bacterium]|nr:FHA domain-containing protein [Pirellulaceae bacterium]
MLDLVQTMALPHQPFLKPIWHPILPQRPSIASHVEAALTMSNHAMYALNEYAVNEPEAGSKGVNRVSAEHSILWIDGIGGYLLWDKPEMVIGQAVADGHADVGITGDLSRRAAVIRRMGSDYLIQPLQATKLNGQAIDRPQLLRDGMVIELGTSVKLRFSRSNALSGTARLEMVSIHRWKPHVDAIMMLADCCIIGPRAGSHIACPEWPNEVLLVQKSSGISASQLFSRWQLRTAEEVLVNGQPVKGQFPLAAGMHVRGEEFSLSFE